MVAFVAILTINVSTARASSSIGLAEVRSGNGTLLASAGIGSFSSPRDHGSALHIGSATRDRAGVELNEVSLAGGLVWVGRIVVPAHGLKGARVEQLYVGGKLQPARPNTLIPLGASSYLVVLQEAVVPGAGAGVVGLRLVVGDSSLGLEPGTQVLVGLARAAKPPPRTQARLSWLALGIAQPHSMIPVGGAIAAPFAAAVGGSTLGDRAVAIAEQYRGVPYVWGGSDPLIGFDCSGLTMFVYRQLGVTLAHYSGFQWSEGTRVTPGELQPGDLVFFEPSLRGPQHVGLYVGGGQFIQAPHRGDVVKISSLSDPHYAFGFVGAVRPYSR